MRTSAYKGGGGFQGCVQTPPPPQFFFDHKVSKPVFFLLNFFCTKEAITLPFIIVYKKV